MACLLAPLGAWAALPLPTGAAPTVDGLQSRIDASRSQEQSLAGDVAKLTRLSDQLAGDVAVLQRREAQVQAELDVKRAELDRTQTALTHERARLAELRARLARSKRVLALRLVEVYKSGRPDALTVILTSHGFTDLLERGEFLGRINEQDKRIVRSVRAARDGARVAALRLGRLEVEQARATAAVQARRNAVASMAGAVAAKRDALASARAARLAALHSARGGRQALEHQLSKLEAEQSSSTSQSGPSGPWAIPWAIVQCESGGQNFPPNSAGASGYYQIIPSTWAGLGGRGPAAYLASKAEQDRVAALLWAGGSGAGNWDCASLVHAG